MLQLDAMEEYMLLTVNITAASQVFNDKIIEA
jgi:hypothetical protein